MSINNTGVEFFINLARTQSILSNRFDNSLSGLGFNEFLILFHLNNSGEQKMRRIDLATKIGMTASGVTRLLLPMEKVHLIKSCSVEKDARVRFVQPTPAGKQKFVEAFERLNLLAEDIIPITKINKLKKISDLLIEISGKTLMT
jgi:DNA-binding MarR family transcriptional regulator